MLLTIVKEVRLFLDKPKVADFLLVNTSNRDCANTESVGLYTSI